MLTFLRALRHSIAEGVCGAAGVVIRGLPGCGAPDGAGEGSLGRPALTRRANEVSPSGLVWWRVGQSSLRDLGFAGAAFPAPT